MEVIIQSTWRGFLMSKKAPKFRQYTEDFKENAVQMYINGGFSFRTVAKELGIPSTPLKEWVKKYRDGESLSDQRGKTTRTSKSFGRPRTRFESVEKERDYLKAQVEYLKKRFQNLYGEGSSQK